MPQQLMTIPSLMALLASLFLSFGSIQRHNVGQETKPASAGETQGDVQLTATLAKQQFQVGEAVSQE